MTQTRLAAQYWCRLLFVAPFFLFLFPVSASAIDTPTNVRGTEVAQSMVKWEWDWVPGAKLYEVTVDGLHAGLTADPQLFSRNLWAGDHSMTVRAIDSSNNYSSRSATAKINVRASFDGNSINRSYRVGEEPVASQTVTQSVQAAPPAAVNRVQTASSDSRIPTNLRATQPADKTIRWEWDPVDGAANYELKVDGITIGLTAETSYTSRNMWIGDHSLAVKSVTSDWRYSEQSETLKFQVTQNGASSNTNTSTTTAAAPPAPQNNQNVEDNGLIDPASWGMSDVYKRSDYELVFSDEFNGNSLNPVRWNSQLRWDGEWNGERYEYRLVNGEDQFYVNVLTNDQGHKDSVLPAYNPFKFNGSRLGIQAIRNPLKRWDGNDTYGPLYNMVSQQTFLSGAISTYDKFTQKYGYFEARIKIPSHVGTFPAFWLHHQKRAYEGTKRSEIDIMENLGHAPWYIYNSFHYYDNVSANYYGDDNFLRPQPDGQIYTGTDYSQNFHTYAVEWKPGYIAWYIDDQKVSELWNGNVNHEELYLILNLAMGGNWTNFPTNSGGLGREWYDHFPNANDIANFSDPMLEIDFVRVYRAK